MSALSIVLLVLGILMLMEGSMVIFYPKWTLKISRKFVRNMEKHLKALGIGEIIIAIILIIISQLI